MTEKRTFSTRDHLGLYLIDPLARLILEYQLEDFCPCHAANGIRATSTPTCICKGCDQTFCSNWCTTFQQHREDHRKRCKECFTEIFFCKQKQRHYACPECNDDFCSCSCLLSHLFYNRTYCCVCKKRLYYCAKKFWGDQNDNTFCPGCSPELLTSIFLLSDVLLVMTFLLELIISFFAAILSSTINVILFGTECLLDIKTQDSIIDILRLALLHPKEWTSIFSSRLQYEISYTR